MNEAKEIARFRAWMLHHPKEAMSADNIWLTRAKLDRTEYFADLCTRIAGYYSDGSRLPVVLQAGLNEAYKVLAEQEES